MAKAVRIRLVQNELLLTEIEHESDDNTIDLGGCTRDANSQISYKNVSHKLYNRVSKLDSQRLLFSISIH